MSSGDQMSPDYDVLDNFKAAVARLELQLAEAKVETRKLQEKQFKCIFCGRYCNDSNDIITLKEHSAICASHPLMHRVAELEQGIREHRSQKADDRCIEDDDALYSLLKDGIKCDRRVGSAEEMHKNCLRFIMNRCEGGGPWVPYAELEKRNAELEKRNSILGHKLDSLAEQFKALQKENRMVRRKLNAVSTSHENVWMWQGLGWEEYAENQAESLNCPVVMMPETMVLFKSAHEHLAMYKEQWKAHYEREGMLLHAQFRMWKSKHLNDEVNDAYERVAKFVEEHEYTDMTTLTIGTLLDQMAREIRAFK